MSGFVAENSEGGYTCSKSIHDYLVRLNVTDANLIEKIQEIERIKQEFYSLLQLPDKIHLNGRNRRNPISPEEVDVALQKLLQERGEILTEKEGENNRQYMALADKLAVIDRNILTLQSAFQKLLKFKQRRVEIMETYPTNEFDDLLTYLRFKQISKMSGEWGDLAKREKIIQEEMENHQAQQTEILKTKQKEMEKKQKEKEIEQLQQQIDKLKNV